jgi:hypothetical protein
MHLILKSNNDNVSLSLDVTQPVVTDLINLINEADGDQQRIYQQELHYLYSCNDLEDVITLNT